MCTSPTFISFPSLKLLVLFQLFLHLPPSLIPSSLSIQQSSTSAPFIPSPSRKCSTLIQIQRVRLLLLADHLVTSAQSKFQNSSLPSLLTTVSGTDHSKHHLLISSSLSSSPSSYSLPSFPLLSIQNSPQLPCLSRLLIFIRLEKSALSTFINHSHDLSPWLL